MGSANEVAKRFIAFLETGEAPTGLFVDEVFCDFTLPKWRLQAPGRESVVALRRQGHPANGKYPDGGVTQPRLALFSRWKNDGAKMGKTGTAGSCSGRMSRGAPRSFPGIGRATGTPNEKKSIDER